MKKILFVDYMGHCLQDKPMGHSIKLLNEYKELICEQYELAIAAPESIIKNINLNEYNKVFRLPFQIDATESNNNFISEKLLQIKKIINLCMVIKEQKKNFNFEYLWFYNVDFMFFILFFMIKIKHCNLICTIYKSDFSSDKHRRRNEYIFKRVLKKMYLVIHTIQDFQVECRAVFIPDYLYDRKKYEKYKQEKKKEKIVCLGTIGSNKNIEELMEAFQNNDYKLEIAGKFRSDKRYEAVKKLQYPNIVIENSYLSEQKYYSMLAEAKFAVLPYDKNDYFKRTSGVLQECLFLDTVPITYKTILLDNCVNGIGIDSIQDLEKIDFSGIDVSDIKENNRKIVQERYSWEMNKRKLQNALLG